jgi:tyrosinase
MLPDDPMATNSVNDPIFWLVHANVDRLWWQWQQTNGVANYQPQAGGPAGHNSNDVMQFLPRPGTPADTFDVQNSMGYSYN